MKKILFLFLTSLISLAVIAQQQDYWSLRNVSDIINTDKSVARQSFPKEFKVFELNINPLRQELFTITASQTVKRSTVITLPNADGNLEQFEVFEASNFVPELQARFPEIRAFSGRGITDKYATVKLSISPQGIQTMVFRTEKENEFIEPYSQDHTVYAVYKSHREKGLLPWTCTTDDINFDLDIKSQLPAPNASGSSSGTLKTLRLAQSVTAEYSNYFGATSAAQVGLVIGAINATLTRSNGCYEKDLALHLNLISNTAAVIYYDPLTDPYSSVPAGPGGNWHTELQSTLTSVIGEANYDIGHLFGATGGGGNAGCIGCVCNDGTKGKGFTSPADGIPMGDNFDIDYVTHEVGHQLGGTHTFSHVMDVNNGTVIGAAQKEVGSGITIMGYAGITGQDVAPHSIDIFHQSSIEQIQANLAGKPCPTNFVMTVNHAPVMGALNNYTIPISTPFALTGSATDAEGDPITYCWEQNDLTTTTGANSVASPTKLTGPNWLSFSPTVSGTRIFPKLSTILSGLFVTPPLPGGDAGANIEALSSVGRTLNFRLTARDNRPYVPGSTIGQTAFNDLLVTVDGAKGPFAVTAPNTATTWCPGPHTVTWSVNGSDALAANVNILLSTDGGTTFPTTLVANTPNDGSQEVNIPSCAYSNTARIKIDAIGNIFFDISDANFTVGDNTPPTFTKPANITIFTDANCNYNASTSVTGIATNINDNCSTGLSATFTEVTVNGPCQGSKVITRTWQLVDNCGNAAANQVQTITVSDNIPPTFTRPANTTIYADATCSYNASVAATGDVTDEADNCSTGLNATFSDAIANGPCIGSKVITRTWSLVDNCGNAAANQVQTITVSDTTRPVISGVSASPNQLWPPNHKMVLVTINYTVTDNCSPASAITSSLSVVSNEPINGTGDGDTAPDWIVVDKSKVWLRAERAGIGNGRIYTVTITSTDNCGNTATTTVNVYVPHALPTTLVSPTTIPENSITLKAMPNPSANNFTLLISSDNFTEKMIFSVYDLYGRIIETKNIDYSKGRLIIGDNYIPGTYIIRVIQGNKFAELKLIKAAN